MDRDFYQVLIFDNDLKLVIEGNAFSDKRSEKDELRHLVSKEAVLKYIKLIGEVVTKKKSKYYIKLVQCIQN